MKTRPDLYFELLLSNGITQLSQGYVKKKGFEPLTIYNEKNKHNCVYSETIDKFFPYKKYKKIEDEFSTIFIYDLQTTESLEYEIGKLNADLSDNYQIIIETLHL